MNKYSAVYKLIVPLMFNLVVVLYFINVFIVFLFENLQVIKIKLSRIVG